MSGELTALANIIDSGNVPLPKFAGRLIQYAPESFDDLRAGEIAVAVRAMRNSGEPVSFASVAPKCPAHSDLFLQLSAAVTTTDDAEFQAEQCWQAFQVRRGKMVFSEGSQSLASSPKQAPAIIAAARIALDAIASDSQSVDFSVRTPDEIVGMVFSDDDMILGNRIIAEGQSTVIAAAGGVGKSRIILQVAACILTGRKFLNFETGNGDYVWLFLQTENSNRRLQDDLKRLQAWLGDDWPKFASRARFHTIENDADSFVNLDSPDAVANIESAIRTHRPDIIVIDPLNDFSIGDLNKDADMKVTLQSLSRICRKGNPRRAIIVLHHALTGRAGASKATGFDRASFGRNSKTLHAWTRAQINLAPVDPDSNEKLIVACGKCSNGREFQTFGIRLNPDSMIYECDPTVDVTQWEKDVSGSKDAAPLMNSDRVRELCPLTGTDKTALSKAIMADCGCYRGSAYRYIARAEQAKQIRFNKSNETYFRK